MTSRLSEFFEDELGHLSMTRLLCFMSFVPASYVVIETKDVDALAWYLGAYVLGYIGGKGADALMKPKQANVTNNVNVEKANVNLPADATV